MLRNTRNPLFQNSEFLLRPTRHNPPTFPLHHHISVVVNLFYRGRSRRKKQKEKKNLFRSSNTLLFFWIACVIVIEIIPITRDAYLFLSLFLFFFFFTTVSTMATVIIDVISLCTWHTIRILFLIRSHLAAQD